MRWCQALVVALAIATVPTGCEAIAALRGAFAAASELGEHLESDLKAELTDDKIDKVLEVTPKLVEFSKTAKHKWEPNPDAPDFQQLATALGGLADYIAFFEGEDTRMTEYYVDLIKINDARMVIVMRKAYAEAGAKLDKERADLETKLAAAQGDAKKPIQEQLDQNARAKKTLDEGHKNALEAREQRKSQPGAGYSLSDDEIARVEARIAEIDTVFKGAGYDKKNDASGL